MGGQLITPHCEPQTFPSTNPASSAPSTLFVWLGTERWEDCVWTRSPGKWTNKSGWNENQTRGGWLRKAITSNEHLSPAQSQSHHPSSSVSVCAPPLTSCHCPCAISLHFLSPPPLFPPLPSSLCCCGIVDLPRGTVGCCRSTRVTGVSLLC